MSIDLSHLVAAYMYYNATGNLKKVEEVKSVLVPEHFNTDDELIENCREEIKLFYSHDFGWI